MKSDDMTFFHEATLKICGSLDVDRVLADTLAFLKRYMPINGILLTIYNVEAEGMRVIGHIAESGVRPVNAPIFLSKEAGRHIAANKDQIKKINHGLERPVCMEIGAALGLGDFATIVLVLDLQDDRLGFAIFYAKRPVRFTDEHARLLHLLYRPLAIAMSNTLRYRKVLELENLLEKSNSYLRGELHQIVGEAVIGEHLGLRRVMEQVRQVTPLDNHVLLLGETGVGKEVIANTIHYLSPRQSGPLVKVNSGAIPENLLDSELFGHEKGAFTGAAIRRQGRFELADTGTIFLDEIGELPPAAQIRLLRVLESHTIERVGGSEPVPVDVRIIAATNRDLEAMVHAGEFRRDLWFRLNVFPIVIPPLRDRKNDIPLLVNHFIDRKVIDMKLRNRPTPSPAAMKRLAQYDWPGNVRELQNAVERELIRHQTRRPYEMLQFMDFGPSPSAESAPDLPAPAPQPPASLDLETVIRTHIRYVMALTGGKVQGKDGAAALLGLHPSTLRHKMRKLGIAFGRARS